MRRGAWSNGSTTLSGVEVDWESVDPVQWRDAVRQVQQWKNGLQEGGSLAWEKGKPAVVGIAAFALTAVATAVVKAMTDPPINPEA